MAEIKRSELLFRALFENDNLFDYLPAGSAADGICQRIEHKAFVEEVCGPTSEQAMKTVVPAPPPAVAAVNATAAVSDLVKRAIFVHRTKPQRKAAIKGIVDVVRNSDVFRPIKGDDRWNKLAESIDNYVVSAIIAP